MSDPIPRLDRAVGWMTGKMIFWYGKRAYDRGDMPEYRHAVATLRAGNSEKTGMRPDGTADPLIEAAADALKARGVTTQDAWDCADIVLRTVFGEAL
jgi:hypothetical protein